MSSFVIEFEDDALRLDLARKPDVPLDRIERSLLEIDGVARVEIFIGDQLVVHTVSPSSDESPLESEPEDPAAVEASEQVAEEDRYDFLSMAEMFEPLLADPRWPHFSASHQWYLDDDELDRVGSATFGESFSLLRSPERAWGQWELGFQAGVFSVFDLEAESSDLVNSDFLVGLTATHHLGDFTSMLRLYHQSSHLGDEFLLRNRVDRVNLSFEVLDLLVSYAPWQWLRLYAGGGVIVHREPDLERGIAQSGLELDSPLALLGGYLRPIAALDLQFREESSWKTDASLRAGFQVEHPYLRRIQLQVLGEFYSGRSPNGQFYERRIKTAGIGLHLGL